MKPATTLRVFSTDIDDLAVCLSFTYYYLFTCLLDIYSFTRDSQSSMFQPSSVTDHILTYSVYFLLSTVYESLVATIGDKNPVHHHPYVRLLECQSFCFTLLPCSTVVCLSKCQLACLPCFIAHNCKRSRLSQLQLNIN